MTLLAMAEGALSPRAAYDWFFPMRKTWGYGRDPEECCRFLGKNTAVSKLIWC